VRTKEFICGTVKKISIYFFHIYYFVRSIMYGIHHSESTFFVGKSDAFFYISHCAARICRPVYSNYFCFIRKFCLEIIHVQSCRLRIHCYAFYCYAEILKGPPRGSVSLMVYVGNKYFVSRLHGPYQSQGKLEVVG